MEWDLLVLPGLDLLEAEHSDSIGLHLNSSQVSSAQQSHRCHQHFEASMHAHGLGLFVQQMPTSLKGDLLLQRLF